MTEQTEAAEVEVARAAATLYDEVRAAVIAEPVGSLARRLHTALGNLAHAVLTSEPAAAEARGAERVLAAVEAAEWAGLSDVDIVARARAAAGAGS